MFKNEYIIKEIKRRLKEYGPIGLLGHLYTKQSLTVAEGTLGLALSGCGYEKTPLLILFTSATLRISPLLSGFGPTS